MSVCIENEIIIKIKKARHGSLFFIDDFISLGNTKSVGKALERLVIKGEIRRVARGLYLKPMISSLIGEVMPDLEEVAKAIAKRDRARIIPTGSYALNALGLSTQVSAKLVYLTDGAARKVSIGNQTILFKRTVPKNLATIGKISGLVIQALKEIGKGKVKEWEEIRIISILRKEEKQSLLHDLGMAPEWIRQIMKKAL